MNHTDKMLRGVYPAVDLALDDGRLYGVFSDATGLIQGEGGVTEQDGPYPPMVAWEMSAGSMLPDDARALGLLLIALADSAEDRYGAKD